MLHCTSVTELTWRSSLKKKMFCVFTNGPRREKTWIWWFSNNKGADQPTLMHSLISAFVARLLESFISRLAMTEISIFQASLCRWADWFESHFVKNPENRFCGEKPELYALLCRLSTIFLKDLNNYEKNISTVSMNGEKYYRLCEVQRKLFRANSDPSEIERTNNTNVRKQQTCFFIESIHEKPIMQTATLITLLAPAYAVFCFPSAPNIPEGHAYEKENQQYIKAGEMFYHLMRHNDSCCGV